jgi:putative ABC transport system permease protein
VRSGLFGLAIAVATVIGVLTYRASLDHLTSTPALAGQSWDDGFGWSDDADDRFTDKELLVLASDLTGAARRTPGIRGASLATFWNQPGGDATIVRAGDQAVVTRFIAFETGPNAVRPSISRGRAAAGPDEVTLNAALLRELGVDLGDAVELAALDGASHEFEVVGASVVPAGDATEGVIATGALTLDGFRRFQPEHPGDLLFFQLDGTRTLDDVLADLRSAGYPLGSTFNDAIHLDVEELVGTSLGETRRLPLLLGSLMAVAGLGVLIHLIAVASRSRRRELGILRAMGFRGGQVVAAVGVQAVVVVLLAFAVGLPLGVLSARVAWSSTAERLGVVNVTMLPWPAFAAALALMLVLGSLAAAAPAFAAARVPAAEVLRAE